MSRAAIRVGLAALFICGPAAAQTSVADTAASPVREMARADASRPGTRGWLGRGFLGGLVAGPFGLGYVVSRANQSAEKDASTASDSKGLSAEDQAIYRQAFQSKLRSRRATSAFLGGAVGTGILVFAIVKLVNVNHDSEILGDGTAVSRIPLLEWRF